MTVNVKSIYLTCRAVIPHMIKQGAADHRELLDRRDPLQLREIAYAASKGAVKQLSSEHRRGVCGEVRCNSVMPGYMRRRVSPTA